MDKEAKAFRREVHRQLGRRGPGQRYPEELRSLALSYLSKARSRGESFASAATDLDLPVNTISRWAAGSNGAAEERAVRLLFRHGGYSSAPPGRAANAS